MSDLLMPKLGLTMQEGVVSEWKVSPGDAFRPGDILVIIETEKVSYEVEAEAAGTLEEILAPAGQTVPVGTPIARWTAADGASAAAEPRAVSGGASAAAGSEGAGPPRSAATPSASRAEGPPRRLVATPLARRIAKELGVDLSTVRGSGASGRIRAADVQRARPMVAGGAQAPAAAERPGPGTATRAPAGPVQSVMARRLAEVKREVPHFYLATEADAALLLKTKDSINADPKDPRITLNHLVLAAVGRALHDLPQANRVWSDGDLVTFSRADVGIAVHTKRGLFVPVLRAAGESGLDELAAEADRLVDKAREGRLAAEEMSGGAVTVSNAGMFNVTYLTPIINPGQSAILGVGSVRQLFRPDDGGRPALRREIGLVLACDHRVFDGVAGIEILNRIVFYLENPIQLLRMPGVKR